MARYKNTGDLYVGKHGSDANPGTDPALPKLTIKGAYDAAVAGDLIIVGDGLYLETEVLRLDSKPVSIQGDGVVILEGGGVDFNGSDIFALVGAASTPRVYFKDLIFAGYIEPFRGGVQEMRDFFIDNCTFLAGSITEWGQENNSASGNPLFNTVKLVNTSIEFGTPAGGSERTVEQLSGIAINSTISNVQNAHIGKIKDFAFIDSQLILDDVNVVNKINNCSFENCTITANSVNYTSVEDARNALGGFLACIDTTNTGLNRLNGETETLDFTVQGSSPLLGSGENGTNIGGVRRGLPQSRLSASVQNGTNTNIVFDGNVWQVQSGQTTGSIETDVIDFGLTVKSPKLTIKGLVNFLDNVPDFDNTLLDPNKLDIEARYAIIGEDISLATYKPFLLNERMLLDVGGNTNGESGFDWANTVTIPMKEIQLRITLRQDYAES